MNLPAFYNQIRHSIFSGKLNEGQVQGVESLISEFNKRGLTDLRWLAYILATAKHETANTMQPIEEFGKGKNYDYGKKLKMNRQPYEHPDKLYYGRGYVQLTWYENYDKMGKLLDLPLLEKPELTLRPDIASQIIFEGMTKGIFTGKKLSDYFNDKKEEWLNARRIINGLNKSQLIAGYAMKFHKALLSSS